MRALSAEPGAETNFPPEPDSVPDILVAGAGACGLVAALRAAELGATVAVLEKLDRMAGNTMLSTGSIPAAGTRFQTALGITDAPSVMAADINRLAGDHDAEHLVTTLAHRSAEVVHWLADRCGVAMKLMSQYRHVGHSVPRLHAPLGGRGSDLLDALAAAADRAGIPVLFGNRVTDLIDDGGRIAGVEVTSGGNRYTVRTRSVILATNGFAANPALMARFAPEIADARYFGAAGSEGEAIVWGERLGAAIGNAAAWQAHASIAAPHGELLTWSIPEKGGFFVNREGRRFGNETLGYSGFAAQVIAQGNQAWAIYDARIRDEVASIQPPFRDLVAHGGARDFPSIEALAQAHGLPPATVSATLGSYADAANGVARDPFGRKDFGRAPLEPPFVATRVEAGLFHTQGGLMVDDRARVLRADGSVIENLFAGGGAAVGVSGRAGGAGYASGNGLLSATVLGYIAGETAARAALLPPPRC